MIDDGWDLRRRLYGHVAETGAVPELAEIHEWVGDAARADALLADLHERHLVVLDEAGAARMLLPFAATDTGHRVFTADRSWWANCAWDSLAIPIALGIDAEIEATWIDTGAAVDLAVRDGALTSTDGFIQWMTPARRWWDDVAET